jgi:hypothetical protein
MSQGWPPIPRPSSRCVLGAGLCVYVRAGSPSGAAQEPDDEVDDTPLEGPLAKLGDKGIGARLWKQRWVAVRDGRLYYSKKARHVCARWDAKLSAGGSPPVRRRVGRRSDGAPEAVPLEQVRRIAINDHPPALTTPKPKPGACFDVVLASGATYHFMAEARIHALTHRHAREAGGVPLTRAGVGVGWGATDARQRPAVGAAPDAQMGTGWSGRCRAVGPSLFHAGRGGALAVPRRG